jgi:thioredoxin-like negative regulator of GroEL
VAFQRKPAKVSEILRPETVPQADTVQEQYFNAVIRNDEAGWNSVSNYFPLSANATNASYSAKARLQLANFYLSDNRLQEADAILDDVFGDPSIDRIYQVAALSRRVFVLEQIGRSKRAADAKQQLHSMYTDLTEDNPKAARLLERWLTKSELAQLGLEDT